MYQAFSDHIVWPKQASPIHRHLVDTDIQNDIQYGVTSLVHCYIFNKIPPTMGIYLTSHG